MDLRLVSEGNMTTEMSFGWRMPDFPEDRQGDPHDRAENFRNQILDYLEIVHGHFDTAWAGDHFFPWAADVDQALDTLEPWTLVAYLMAKFPRLKFCPSVLNQAYRSPALVAKMAAVLQLLSAGRLILGIGAGWKENEQRAYGYDFPPAKVRLDQLEESVQIIRKMWTEDSPTFTGKYYSIKNAYCSPRPVPAPPLLIGGFGLKRTLKIVARYADWCNINDSDVAFCRSRLDALRGHCTAVGSNYDAIIKSYICDCVALAATHERAEAIKQASFFAPYQPMVGTPDELTKQLQAYADLGFTHLVLRFADYPKSEGVELFIKEVLPRFRAEHPQIPGKSA
jgi:alkanesulfonate monooxygenase SsuD/methylene tetrahydromethanopterin reductase-like flavin-dependent oxidoreductase (luciferase family)